MIQSNQFVIIGHDFIIILGTYSSFTTCIMNINIIIHESASIRFRFETYIIHIHIRISISMYIYKIYRYRIIIICLQYWNLVRSCRMHLNLCESVGRCRT